MAGMTERHQISVSMVTTFCQRLDVMHLLRLHEPSFLLAPLTKRVCIHVPVTDAFPRPAIFSFGYRVATVLLISLVLYFLMFLTKSAVCQPGTAGVGTRTLGFSRHRTTSSGQKKSPAGLLPQGRSVFCFSDSNYTIGARCIAVAFSGLFRKRHPKPCGGAGTAPEAHIPCPRRSAPRI